MRIPVTEKGVNTYEMERYLHYNTKMHTRRNPTVYGTSSAELIQHHFAAALYKVN